MVQFERRRSPRQAAKALIVAGAIGTLVFAGVSGALAQRDDLYDDEPSGASGIFGDDFPGGMVVFPSGVFDDDHASGIFDEPGGGDINVGGSSGGTITVGGNGGGGISIGGGSGMSGGGGGSGNGAGGGGGQAGGYGR
jgi:hypothetical protein